MKDKETNRKVDLDLWDIKASHVKIMLDLLIIKEEYIKGT